MILTKKKWLEEKINLVQGGVWWNELVLDIQKKAGDTADKIDSTVAIIEKDKTTLDILKEEYKKL